MADTNKQKDFIKDGMTNDDIINTLKKIRSVIENKSNNEIIEELKKEHDLFSSRYPVLFELATRKDEPFNWEYLQYFLNMRSKIVNDEITSEKASVVVGEEWFKRHVNVNKDEKMSDPIKFTRAAKKSKTNNN
jgi:3-methyladenine DNA glycosylase Tag